MQDEQASQHRPATGGISADVAQGQPAADMAQGQPAAEAASDQPAAGTAQGQRAADAAQEDQRAADAASPASSANPASSASSANPASTVAAAQRQPTGEARVDQAMASLDELHRLPVTEHPPVFEQVHRRLREVLGELDPGPDGGTPAAGRAGPAAAHRRPDR
jgi:hypothetical protein